jgi:hypothetical protein
LRQGASAEDDWLVSLQNRESGGHQMMRQRRIREWGGNRRRGDASLHGNRHGLAAALRRSGEKFCSSLAAILWEIRGERERASWAI